MSDGSRMGRWRQPSKDCSLGNQPRPEWGWSLPSCPTLRRGGRAFELLVQVVIGLVVKVVGVANTQMLDSEEASGGSTSCRGAWACLQQHPAQRFICSRVSELEGQSMRCSVVWLDCQIAVHKGCISLHFYQQHLRMPTSAESCQISLLLNFWIFANLMLHHGIFHLHIF